MKKQLFLYIILMLVCSAPKSFSVPETETDKPGILIALMKGADSKFKQELISQIKTDYAPRYPVKVKKVKKYKDIAKEQYEAVIVMDKVKAWLWKNKGLKDIITNADCDKTVVFVSSNDPKWTLKRQDVKLVTSATDKSVEPGEVYKKLKLCLDEIVK